MVLSGVWAPVQPRGVAVADVALRGVDKGVFNRVLLDLLPRGSGVEACISLLPASSIQRLLSDSSAARYSCCASLSSRPGK